MKDIADQNIEMEQRQRDGSAREDREIDERGGRGY